MVYTLYTSFVIVLNWPFFMSAQLILEQIQIDDIIKDFLLSEL